MDVCYCCSAEIWFPPSGVEWCSACLGNVKFHSSLPNKWGICPDRDVGCDSPVFFFIFFQITGNFVSLILVVYFKKKKGKIIKKPNPKQNAKIYNENYWTPVFCYVFRKCQEISNDCRRESSPVSYSINANVQLLNCCIKSWHNNTLIFPWGKFQ